MPLLILLIGGETMSSNRHFDVGFSHFGEDGTGHDVKAFGDTSGMYCMWDASANSLGIGTLATPITLATNPGATVAPFTVNLLHSAGAGDCGDLIASYKKVAVTGDGDAGITIVGDAPRAYVGTVLGTTVASAAYASQPWAKHDGTGAITAMSALSALVDVNTDNFTASTVNAGHFHIEGAATVTGQFDGVHIEVYPDVTCLDAGLAISVDSGAVVNSAIRLAGSTSYLLDLAEGTAVTKSDPTIGAANVWLFCRVGATNFWIQGYADTP